MRFKDWLQRELCYRSQIDWLYYVVENLAKNKEMTALEICKESLSAIRQIVRLKKSFGFAYEDDNNTINELVLVRSKLKNLSRKKANR